MNDLKRFFRVAMLIGIIAFSSISIVFATTESELKSKKNSIDEQIAETNSEIDTSNEFFFTSIVSFELATIFWEFSNSSFCVDISFFVFSIPCNN